MVIVVIQFGKLSRRVVKECVPRCSPTRIRLGERRSDTFSSTFTTVTTTTTTTVTTPSSQQQHQHQVASS